MSSQSLKEHATKKPFTRNVFRANTSKLHKIQVSPSPQLDVKRVDVAEKRPSMEKELPPFIDTKEGQRVSTPDVTSGHQNTILEMDETKTLWSKVESGNEHHKNSSSMRRCRPNEAYLMRILITLAFIFSVTNLGLTVLLLTRGQSRSCACQEKSAMLGKIL